MVRIKLKLAIEGKIIDPRYSHRWNKIIQKWAEQRFLNSWIDAIFEFSDNSFIEAWVFIVKVCCKLRTTDGIGAILSLSFSITLSLNTLFFSSWQLSIVYLFLLNFIICIRFLSLQNVYRPFNSYFELKSRSKIPFYVRNKKVIGSVFNRRQKHNQIHQDVLYATGKWNQIEIIASIKLINIKLFVSIK